MTHEMYYAIPDAMKTIENCPDTRVLMLTGSNGFYSSGNDLSVFSEAGPPTPENFKKFSEKSAVMLEAFVSSFIDFKKPLVAKVDGMSLGIACTTLALCDFVYASERAWFQTPFTKIAQAPEGCSSFTFPQLMGRQKASEILLLNRRITAQEAYERNLVNEVFKVDEIDAVVDKKLEYIASLPPKSIQSCKASILATQRQTLHEINHHECQNLIERWTCLEELLPQLAEFANRKKK